VGGAARMTEDGLRRPGSPGEVVANINLIVAMAYGRAGSILVQSLFDGHPNVLTLPHLGPMYSLMPPSIDDLDRQIDWFVNRFPTIFDTSKGGYFCDSNEFVAAKFGPNGDEDLRVSPMEFKKHLLDIASKRYTIDGNRQLSRKEFFILVHLAYGLCVKSFDVTDISYIFYHTHSYVHEEWQNMLEDFPELYFIGMTRDPRQDWTSWKKIHASRMQKRISDVPPICLFLSEYHYSKSSYELSRLVEKLKPDHIRIMDLEKLHILNKKAMTHLCSWLHIEFNECLLQSTFNGLQWHGNAANGKKLPTFNPNMTQDAWRSELDDHDRRIICSLVPGSIGYLGYDKENPAIGIESENAIDDLKYRNALLLLTHCTLYLSGDPIRRFRKSWQSSEISKVRIIRSLGGDFYRGARLFFELRGDGVGRKIAEIVAQQNEILQKSLPLSAFVTPQTVQNSSSHPD
jgi:hypothetical protein